MKETIKGLVSIIIPIYNVEEYLVRCFDSIYSQGVNEDIFEVIAVIDGSPDNSIDITKEYARNHKNLIVIEKENGGVSSARNKGMDVATGEHIMFIDPDDSLLPNCLSSILSKIDKQKTDLIILRSFVGTEQERYPWIGTFETDKIYTGLEVYEKGYTRGSIWAVVYSRNFLMSNNLYLPLNIKNSEDSIFFMQCQIAAEKVLFADIKAYSITERPGSASRSMNETRLILWFKALEYIKELKKEKQYKGLEKSIADGLTYSILSDITNNSIKLMGWKAKRFLISNKIKEFRPICNKNIKHSLLINKIMKHILNNSFNLFFCISYIRYKINK